MVMVSFSIQEDYWENFELQDADIEFLYNTLLELETPLTSAELIRSLVKERIQREKVVIEEQRSSGGDLYQPKGEYTAGQALIFPAVGWRRATVEQVRPGKNPDLGEFQVIEVTFDNGEKHEFAAGLEEHVLNQPLQIAQDEPLLDPAYVMEHYGESLEEVLEQDLEEREGFVRIAGRWFARSLLVDVNVGHLNLAEAVLDMEGGGPMPPEDLIAQIDLTSAVNPKLIEFSLDLALQEDQRFDEVGPAGKVLWFLKRLEPKEVLETPLYLRYNHTDYDRDLLSDQMLELERDLGDELSPIPHAKGNPREVEVALIYPHWRAGTLPLSQAIRHLFPTAYEAPRIRFILVDGDDGSAFPGWVVPEKRYVFGLKDWYQEKGVMSGSIIRVRKGENPGEVIIQTDGVRASREWVRTVLVGSDGGLVMAMLKQVVNARFDERMSIAAPDPQAVDRIWEKMHKERPPFERVVVNIMRELAKLNPQSHVHLTELYAAVNVVKRCPPGPIMALLASRSWFVHVGDLHYRFNDAE